MKEEGDITVNRNNEIFSNYYKVLEILYENQITINDITFAPMSQTDIGKAIGCDRTTINPIIKKLKANDMLIKDSGRGRYQLTDKAIKTIKAIRKIES